MNKTEPLAYINSLWALVRIWGLAYVLQMLSLYAAMLGFQEMHQCDPYGRANSLALLGMVGSIVVMGYFVVRLKSMPIRKAA